MPAVLAAALLLASTLRAWDVRGAGVVVQATVTSEPLDWYRAKDGTLYVLSYGAARPR